MNSAENEINVKKESIILQAFDIILIILYAIIAIIWLKAFISGFSYANIAFELLDIRNQAIVCYCIPCLIVIAIIAMGIYRVCQHLYYITWGWWLMALSGMAAVGRSIFQSLPLDNGNVLIGTFVFGIFGEIWIISLAMSVVVTICVYVKAKLEEI